MVYLIYYNGLDQIKVREYGRWERRGRTHGKIWEKMGEKMVEEGGREETREARSTQEHYYDMPAS
jgi:hypothetical protein